MPVAVASGRLDQVATPRDHRLWVPVGLVAIWIAWDATGPVRHRFDGQCLTHARDEVRGA